MRLLVLRIVRDALHRANLDALRRIEMPYTLGTLFRIDDIVLNAL